MILLLSWYFYNNTNKKPVGRRNNVNSYTSKIVALVAQNESQRLMHECVFVFEGTKSNR